MIFWAEAAKGIGLGHLMESLALAGELRARGAACRYLITPYAPAGEILDAAGLAWEAAPLAEGPARLAPWRAAGERWCVVDHRAAAWPHLAALQAQGWQVAVLDQLGGKPVICQVLVNPSLPPPWLCYDFPQGEPRLCLGPAYALLRPEFRAWRGRPPEPRRAPPRVLVTLGGVDRTGATLRVVEALAGLGPGVAKEVILGAGFAHQAALDRLAAGRAPGFSFHRAVTDLARRLARADLVISAGGNTLYEAAALGVPALVLWEDPHEALQGEAFAARGAAWNLGKGMATGLQEIREAVAHLLADPARREAMSRQGRDLVDGQGVGRLADILLADNSEKGGVCEN
ncbi:MAG: hypothetical protein KQJ78_07095 [Deltaproteobacteria bacterium]|nr:hypothetical protein [Deltaproteobacteria bacterium]